MVELGGEGGERRVCVAVVQACTPGAGVARPVGQRADVDALLAESQGEAGIIWIPCVCRVCGACEKSLESDDELPGRW